MSFRRFPSLRRFFDRHNAPSSRQPSSRPLRVESLESRCLLAVDLPLISPAAPSNLNTHLTDLMRQNLAAFSSSVSNDGAQQLPSPKSLADANPLLQFDAAERPLVNIWTTTDVLDVAAALGDYDATIYAASNDFHVLEAALNVDDLAAVAGMTGVLSVTPVYRPYLRSGSVQTQGDAVLNADDVRAAGYDGSSFLIGVMSDSALNIDRSQDTGDLPALIDRYLEFPASDEGRAMLEIIHDIAPGASLAHHSAILSELSFADGIRRLAEAGSRIIVDDIGYYAEPFFQDGVISQAIDEVAAGGVVYVSAAGNDTDRSYESMFADADPGGASDFHDFDPSAGVDTRQQVTVPAGYGVTLILQWDDPFYTMDGVTHDFNVKVYDSAGELVKAGSNNNVSTQQPLEIIQWFGEGDGVYEVEIERVAGDGPSFLKYVLSTNSTVGTIDEYATNSGTITGHATAAGAIAVGAVPYYDPTNIEAFSSVGSATIYFDAAGNRLASPEVRNKPDVVAPDNVNTTFFGRDIPEDSDTYRNFAGTSAAAPHVAAVAALLFDANPHLTRDELYSVLTSTAVDLGAAGRDEVYGFGLVDAEAARIAAQAVVDVTAPTATLLSPLGTFGWHVEQLQLSVSEPLAASAAGDAANYVLVAAGADALFDTADDVAFTVTPVYDADALTITLTIAAPTTVLADELYRLTLDGTSGITDETGNGINGGVDQAIYFSIAPQSDIISIEGASSIDARPDGTTVMVYENNPVIRYRWPQIMVGQYSPEGQVQGPYLSAPTDINYSYRVRYADVSVNSGGGVFVYNDHEYIIYGEPDDYDIGFQLIDASGRVVGDRQVAFGIVGGYAPRVDVNEAGQFTIVSGVSYYDSSADRYYPHIRARFFDSSGAPRTSILTVNANANALAPVVAVTPDGGAVIAWHQSGVDSDAAAIVARRYDASGAPLGDEFQVNTTTAGAQTYPEIAVGADGSFVIAWRQTSSTSGILFQRYDASGQPVGGEQMVFPSGTSQRIDMAPDGRFVVAWHSADGDGDGVFAQRYNADGTPFGERLWISGGAAGDQQSPRVAMADNGDFVVTYDGATTEARWISWDAPDEVLPFGPWVRSTSPFGETTAPFSSIDFTFDRPIQTATLTTADVTLTDPAGRELAISSLSVDGQAFTIEFAAQQLPGRYTLRIGADVLDLNGLAMNQDGDDVNGESLDAFVGHFLLPSTAASFPLVETFEVANIDSLGSAWSFAAETGEIDVTPHDAPHAGGAHLRMSHNSGGGWSRREAVVQIDLSGQAGATNLELDFWMQAIGTTSNNYGIVQVSGDGVSWTIVPGTNNLRASAVDLYEHYAIDFDEALDQAGIAFDGDVYVKLVNNAVSDSAMTFDDVRISNVDVFGPSVVAQSPEALVPAPLSSFTVTFDEEIDAASFTAADVEVTGPTGAAVSLSGDPVDSGDHRTFTINFAAPQSQSGTYTFTIGPDVRDVQGNAMNQDGDFLSGEVNGQDRYAGVLQVGQLTAQPAPYFENFDAGSLGPLAANWSFSITGSGTIGVTDGDTPHSGGYHLDFGQAGSGYTSQHAQLLLDLSAHAAATNLELDFWMQRLGTTSSNTLSVDVSGDGQTWEIVEGYFTPPALGQYTHFAIDLDAALDAKGIARDGDVHVRFRHSGSSAAARMTLDDVRIDTVDVFGPSVVGLTPSTTGSGPLSWIDVSFDETIDGASFTVDDVELIGPDGLPRTLAGDPLDSGDQQTFRVSLETPESLAGVFQVLIGPDVRDPAGNAMNQDQDTASGESGQDVFVGEVATTALAQAFPVVQGFESGALDTLPGWSFAAAAGTISVGSAEDPHGGAYQLKMSSPSTVGSTSRDAVLALDLSSQAGATDLELDFWMQMIGTTNQNSVSVYVSGDGQQWTAAAGGASLSSTAVGQYQHFAFDLDASLAAAAVALDADVYIKFTHSTYYTGRGVALDDVRVSNVDAFGPSVASHTPSSPQTGTLSSITVTFDEPIDPTSFTATDVVIVNPAGQTVALAENPEDGGDQTTFTLTFATPQTIAGTYQLRVGPGVRDAAGNAMNQDGDAADGETNGHDAYQATFAIAATPLAHPHVEDFEAGSLAAVAGWSFTAADGAIAVVSTDGPHGGAHHLMMTAHGSGNTWTSRAADLVVDLSGQAAATDLVLDFWMQSVAADSNNYTSVYVSGDGLDWTVIDGGASLRSSAVDRYEHFAFDLDQALGAAGVALDADVYIRLQHNAYYAGRRVTFDDVRVSNEDAFGPRIVSQTPSTQVTGSLASISVTFNEPIDAASFTALDVSVSDPSGAVVPLAGDPVDSGDQTTFTISFAAPQALAGTYVFVIGPDVRDVAGNYMNQDGDAANRELGGVDDYAGVFQIGGAAQLFPTTQTFESGSLVALPGWSFAATTGTISIESSNTPHGGSYHLQMTGPNSGTGWTTREAALLLDLSGQVGAVNLELDFWMQAVQSNSSNYANVYISGDGVAWTLAPDGGSLSLEEADRYQHFVFDLDEALDDASIDLDADVYIKVTHNSYYSGGTLTFDDVRVSNIDAVGPKLLSNTPVAPVSEAVSSITVTFDEPIDVASFTMPDVSITDPAGRNVRLAGNPLDSGDQQTFTLNFLSPQELPGAYRVNVGPRVRDAAGNEMNQDGDVRNGEQNGHDVYTGTFSITSVAHAFPKVEDFEAGDLESLTGWSFASSAGEIVVDSLNGPHGGRHLRMAGQTSGNSSTTREAVLLVDLAGQSGATNLELDLWLQALGSTSSNYLNIDVSGDGAAWSTIAGSLNLPSLGQYQHFAFDLDAALVAAGIDVDEDVYIRLQHATYNAGRSITLDDVRVSNVDAFGPRVTAQSPDSPQSGSVSSLTITFDEAIDAATFTVADVAVIDPGGAVVVLSGNPVDSGDQKTFTIPFAAPQATAGDYQIVLDADIRDVSGNRLNQDGDAANGETNGHDDYTGRFSIVAAAQPFPLVESFEGGSLSSLPGWSFKTNSGTILVDSANSPRTGGFHLVWNGPPVSGSSSREATLLLDLAAQNGATDLELDFWMQALGATSSNGLSLAVSGDGAVWTNLPDSLTLSTTGVYQHFAIDLDAALAAAAIDLDADVYIKFTHSTYSGGRTLTIDDVRVSNVDAFGPRIVSQTPVDQVTGSVTSLTVTFDEAIDAASFTAADVIVSDPGGTPVALAGDPVDSGDHKTFTINFASPQVLAGTYQFRVGPDIRDAAGNLMNQDGDAGNGETNGNDDYDGVFQIGGAAQLFPALQSFESGTLGSLPGWSFAVGGGAVDVSSDGGPHGGNYHLRMIGPAGNGSTQRDAVLLMDLSSQVGATNLELDFWMQGGGISTSNYGHVYVSGDGAAWSLVPDGGNLHIPSGNPYQHFTFDLDQALSTAGIDVDADIYLKFTHTSYYSNSTITLDDVRVSNVDAIGASVASITPAGPVAAPLSSLQVTFSEPIDVAAFTAADVVVTDPAGSPVALSADPVDSGDQTTFTLNFAAQTLPGTYYVAILPDILDLSGNQLNQDGDVRNGEINGDDSYVAAVQVAGASRGFPVAEGFESGQLLTTPGFSFNAASGTIEVADDGAPQGGSYHLRMTGPSSGNGWTTRDAILQVDLSGHVGATNLGLDFYMQANNTSSNRGLVSVSGDGQNWTYLPGGDSLPVESANQYQRYAFDLDAGLLDAAIALDDDVYIKFTHYSTFGGRAVMFDDIRVTNLDVLGPRVVSQTPLGEVSAGVTSVEVTFDEAIDPAEFTLDDVALISPQGTPVALTGNPVASGDQKTFTLNFTAAQNLAGDYQLRIGPDVRDLAGNPMNQDGDTAVGETDGDDEYLSVFTILAAAQPFPYTADFEAGDLGALSGWSFTSSTGAIDVSSANAPHGGGYHLRMTAPANTGYTSRDATLLLDLESQFGATDLELDFWMQRFAANSGHSMSLYVSGDGTNWYYAIGLNTSAVGVYEHFALDLDEILAAEGVLLDADVYLRIRQSTYYSSSVMTIDDLRVSNIDVFGPRMLSHTPSTPVSGPVSLVTVTFDEDIDPATFTASDVTIVDPVGTVVPLAADPVDSGDHRTFSLNLTEAQSQAGVYYLRVDPDVRDTTGNWMNQDGDAVSGETYGDDEYYETFQIAAVPQAVPYVEGFEGGAFSSLAGWSFASAAGEISVDGEGTPHGGGYHLRMQSPGTTDSTSRQADFVMDLSSQFGATDLVLDFWAQRLEATNYHYVSLHVSGDGQTWQYAAGLYPSTTGHQHYAFDLDALLASHGVAVDGDVYIRLRQDKQYASGVLTLDDFRVRNATLNNAPTLTTVGALTGTEDQPLTIDYAMLAAAADKADANGDPIAFRVAEVVSGTLSKDGAPVAPGTTLIGVGESLVWTPDAHANGAIEAFTIRAWDGEFDSGTPVPVRVSVSAVNDAPVLDATGTPAVPGGPEDSTPTNIRIDFLVGDSITDVDAGSLEGIAVVGLTGTSNGTWRYYTGSWHDFPAVSEASALLLSSANYVRFLPDPDFNGMAAIQYRAWDRTSGSAGGAVDLSGAGAVGGATAFSTDVETATTTITPVNDAPLLDAGGAMSLASILEDAVDNNGTQVSEIIASAGGDRITDIDHAAVEGIAVISAVTTNGDWQYSIDNGNTWSSFGFVAYYSARLLRTNDRVRFVPNADFGGVVAEGITFKAWDQYAGTPGGVESTSGSGYTTPFSTASETASIAVTPVGDTPRVADITTLEDTPSGPIVIDRHAADGAEVTHFRISSITGGVLFQNNGSTPINNGDFITFAEAQAGVVFRPAADSNTPGSFNVESSEDGVSVADQSGTATSTITVTP
ncbi:MAG: Ig-like domain-containing protein, partial [Pirellulaceae bacterium]